MGKLSFFYHVDYDSTNKQLPNYCKLLLASCAHVVLSSHSIVNCSPRLPAPGNTSVIVPKRLLYAHSVSVENLARTRIPTTGTVDRLVKKLVSTT